MVLDEITDQVDRDAAESQIENYGQTPSQLFAKKGHPARTVLTLPTGIQDYITSLVPTPARHHDGGAAVHFLAARDGSLPVAHSAGRVAIPPEHTHVITWGHWDQTLRVCHENGRILSMVDVLNGDKVRCVAVAGNGRTAVTGGASGIAKVWRISAARRQTLQLWMSLTGHTGGIRAVAVSVEWSIIVTGSRDRTCIVWDLNTCAFVRSISCRGPVTALAISPSTGAIAAVSAGADALYHVQLFTINGQPRAVQTSASNVNALVFSAGVEGVSNNVVVGGLDDGRLVAWSAWDLAVVAKYKAHKAAVTAVCLSADGTELLSGDELGLIVVWAREKEKRGLFGSSRGSSERSMSVSAGGGGTGAGPSHAGTGGSVGGAIDFPGGDSSWSQDGFDDEASVLRRGRAGTTPAVGATSRTSSRDSAAGGLGATARNVNVGLFET